MQRFGFRLPSFRHHTHHAVIGRTNAVSSRIDQRGGAREVQWQLLGGGPGHFVCDIILPDLMAQPTAAYPVRTRRLETLLLIDRHLHVRQGAQAFARAEK